MDSTRLGCHCLLIEGAEGLVLVDTGFGVADTESPRQLGRPFLAMTRPQARASETALAQVRALGFDPHDVRHIITTHLDLDHAGGLPDFPTRRSTCGRGAGGRHAPAPAGAPAYVASARAAGRAFGFERSRRRSVDGL